MYRVLTVDDERYVRLWLKNCLNWEELGFTIIGEAANGRDALDLIQDNRPELVVTDMEMKGMDGIELMKQTRDCYPDTEFLILSGYNSFEYVKSAVTYEAVDYLLKPVEAEELKTALVRVAGRLKKKERLRNTILTTMEENKRYKAEKLIFMLVDSEQYAIDRIMEMVNDLELPMKGEGCIALILALKQEKSTEAEAVTAAACRAVKEQMQRSGCPVCCAARDNKIYVLLEEGGEGLRENEIRSQCERLRRYLEIHFHLTVLAGIGRKVPDLLCVGKSFQEAGEALEICGVRNEDGIYQYMDMPHAVQKEVIQKYDEAVFANALARLDETAARECIGEVFLRISSLKEADIETVRMVYYRLLTIIIQEIYDSGMTPSMLDIRLERFFRAVNEPLSIGQMQEVLLKITAQYVDTGRKLQQTSNTAIEEARSYIDQHYREEISLRDIAEEIHMSASYLSSIFKARTGINVMDYITKKRMDEVVFLMKNPALKIYEISVAAGYQDTKYFSKVFRKIYRYSPSEYRKMLLKEMDGR
ncbi:response regulator [Diplocloster agilis]|uniref:Stage 0 sporulation protein A homolog n=1 Tax=Diplocloster agilis TaxID=2850323 RepID=A0A949JXE6_9FIRM|nr:response regulator [Diplocloster agilis]MBU9734995.1 response regulator [Diplocloster agilis]MBU9742479.1 response regulator [Diplocloster agilis]